MYVYSSALYSVYFIHGLFMDQLGPAAHGSNATFAWRSLALLHGNSQNVVVRVVVSPVDLRRALRGREVDEPAAGDEADANGH